MSNSTAKKTIALLFGALTLSSCAVYDGVTYDRAYDGYYDGYYGPYIGGYWGADDVFWYSDRQHHYYRDDAHHFQHQRAPGDYRFHGMRHPPGPQPHGGPGGPGPNNGHDHGH